MLAFDARKNLFVRTTRAEIANVDLTGYATLTEVQSLIDNIDSGIATSIDWNNVTNKPVIPSIAGLATEAFVTQQIAASGNHFTGDYNDLRNKPTVFSGSYLDLTNRPVIPSIAGLASEAFVAQQIALSQPDLSSYASTQYVDTQIALALTGGVDLSGYYTSAQVDALLASYQPSVDLTAYALKTEIPSVPTDVSELTDTQGLLNTVDLSGYATTGFVTNQLSAYQPAFNLSLYATKAYVAGEIFSGDYNDLSNKPTLFSGNYNDLINKPTIFSGSYTDLTNRPIIPSIEGLASIAYVDQQIANVAAGGSIDLSSYVTDTELQTALAGVTGNNINTTGLATQTYVQQQISAAGLSAISALNDLSDVAIDYTLDAQHQGLIFNGVNNLWENVDLEDIFATKSYVTEQVANIVSNGQITLDGFATTAYVDEKLVARGPHFSGNYNELYNRPILFSGDYRDLTNKPADSSSLQLQIESGTLKLVNVAPNPDVVLSTVDLSTLGSVLNYDDLTNLPDLFSGNYNDLVNRPVLFSGNYNDLANKPYIPSIAGLATETYVNNKHAEPDIWGNKIMHGNVTFESFTLQKSSTVSHTAAVKNMVMAIQTTNAIPTEVLLNGGSKITIATGTTAMFKITFVATSGPDAASFIVRGIVDNNGSGVRLIGVNITETIADSDQPWTGAASANIANNSLKIVVTGTDATTVDWTVFVELSEVIR